MLHSHGCTAIIVLAFVALADGGERLRHEPGASLRPERFCFLVGRRKNDLLRLLLMA